MNMKTSLLLGVLAMAAGPTAGASDAVGKQEFRQRVAAVASELAQIDTSLKFPYTPAGQVDMDRLIAQSDGHDATASYTLGRLYGNPKIARGQEDYARSLKYYKAAIGQQPKHVLAHLWLANLVLEHGATLAEPASVAIDHLNKVASLGDARGFLDLSGMYLYGRGVPRDPDRALVYAKKAAAMGSEEGKYRIDNWGYLVQISAADTARSN